MSTEERTEPTFFDAPTKAVLAVAGVVVIMEALGLGSVRFQVTLQLLVTGLLFLASVPDSLKVVKLAPHKAMARFWVTCMISLVVRGLADLGTGLATIVGHPAHPELQPAISKALYALALLCIMREFIRYPLAAETPRERTRVVLDLCTVMIAVCGFGWFFILAPHLKSPFSGLSLAVAIGQFGLVLLYASFVRLMLSSAAFPFTPRSNLLTLGILAFYGPAEGLLPVLAGTPDVRWVFVLRLLGLAVQYVTIHNQVYDMRRGEYERPRPKKAFHVTPYTAIASLYALLIGAMITGGTLTLEIWGVFASAVATTALVVVRQLSAFIDNAQLFAQVDQNLHDLQESYQREQDAHAAREQLEVEVRHLQKLEALGRMAGGVAHEINTPVQVLQNNVTFLEDSFCRLSGALGSYRRGEQVPSADAEEVDFMLEEVPGSLRDTSEGLQRIADIVRSLRSFGSDEGEHGKVLCDLGKVIRDALVVVHHDVDKVAELVVSCDDDLSVHGNVRDLGQVWLHLLMNAGLAIEEKGQRRGTIEVRAFHERGSVVVEVTDDGVGMDEDVASRMFDPFYTTRSVGSGQGQGLSIARSIVVDGHGGTIDFRSELGVGSTFRVTLPAVGRWSESHDGGPVARATSGASA